MPHSSLPLGAPDVLRGQMLHLHGTGPHKYEWTNQHLQTGTVFTCSEAHRSSKQSPANLFKQFGVSAVFVTQFYVDNAYC